MSTLIELLNDPGFQACDGPTQKAAIEAHKESLEANKLTVETDAAVKILKAQRSGISPLISMALNSKTTTYR